MEPLKAVAILGVVIGGYACIGPLSELQEHQYPNTAAARAADRGWIPDILPGDATRIREVHKVDATRAWGCFVTHSSDELRRLLRQIPARESRGPIGARPAELFRDFSRWPESMSSGTVEAWEFDDSPGCPLCTPALVRVGIDPTGEMVCFHRT